MELYHDNFSWVISPHHNMAFASVIFLKFLRQAEEHFASAELLELRKRELDLCVRIWQDKQAECYNIGKELIRILTNVAKLPQLAPIFADLNQIFD